MKKFIFLILILLIGGFVGYYFFVQQNNFKNLTVGEMRERIIKERDVAIKKAAESGNYRCCIDPPCTMCFMEANQWNNQTAGTCACDDLIAEGKEPCPQCGRSLKDIHNQDGIFCDINAEISTCDSNN